MDFWEWLQQALFYLAIVNLGMALVATGLLTWSGHVIKRLIDVTPKMDGLPSISLIAPARNEDRNIERAVRSLVQLDYPELEITIVDDRSTDQTGEILDRLAAEF